MTDRRMMRRLRRYLSKLTTSNYDLCFGDASRANRSPLSRSRFLSNACFSIACSLGAVVLRMAGLKAASALAELATCWGDILFIACSDLCALRETLTAPLVDGACASLVPRQWQIYRTSDQVDPRRVSPILMRSQISSREPHLSYQERFQRVVVSRPDESSPVYRG